jgi:hypothetical protein
MFIQCTYVESLTYQDMSAYGDEVINAV